MLKNITKNDDKVLTFQNRAIRAAWICVWAIFASWTPPSFRAWRRLLLRIFGAEIAPTAIVYGSTKVWLPSNLKMEEFSCLGPRVICYDMAQITVQSHATVSQGSHLCAGTHDINTASFPLVVKPIIIGSHAWIAAEAFVGPGVHVGNYCVLGARAVAFHNLEEKGVYIGNPAVLKKSRQSFDEASRK